MSRLYCRIDVFLQKEGTVDEDLLTRVDLYSTGVPGYLWAEVRLVNDTGALLVHHVVWGESLAVGGLRGGGAGGERLVQEVSLVQQVAGTVTPTARL